MQIFSRSFIFLDETVDSRRTDYGKPLVFYVGACFDSVAERSFVLALACSLAALYFCLVHAKPCCNVC